MKPSKLIQVCCVVLFLICFFPGCVLQQNDSLKWVEKGNQAVKAAQKLKFYFRALQADKNCIEAHVQLHLLFSGLPGQQLNALKHVNWILDRIPLWPQAKFNQARLYWLTGDFKKAATELKEVRKGLKRWEVDYALAMSFAKEGHIKFALNEFLKAYKRNSKKADIPYNMGVCYAFLGRWDKAIEAFDLAESLSSDAHDVYTYRGLCKFNRGEIAGAKNDFGASLRLKSEGNWIARYFNAQIFRHSGHDKEYVKEIDELMKSYRLPSIIHLERAEFFMASNRYKKAIKAYSNILERDPNFYQAYFYLAKAKKRMGDEEGAKADYAVFRKFKKKLDPEPVKLEKKFEHPELGEEEGTKNEVDPYDFSRVFILPKEELLSFLFGKMENIQPPHFGINFLVLRPFPPAFDLNPAYAREQMERYKDIAKQVRKERKYRKGSGDSEYAKKNWEDLILEDRSKKFKLDEGVVKGIAILMVILIGGGVALTYNIKTTDVAKETLKKALEADDPEEKLDLLNQAVEKNPYFRDGYFQRARFYRKEGKWEEVLADCSKLVQLSPDNGEVYRLMGIAKKELGDFRGSKMDFKKATELRDSVFFLSRGINKLKAGEYSNAIKILTRAISRDPELALAYSNRGVARMHTQDKEEALEDYNKAIELDPEYVNAYKNRASAYESLEMKDLMQKDLDKVKVLEEKLERRRAEERARRIEMAQKTVVDEVEGESIDGMDEDGVEE